MDIYELQMDISQGKENTKNLSFVKFREIGVISRYKKCLKNRLYNQNRSLGHIFFETR